MICKSNATRYLKIGLVILFLLVFAGCQKSAAGLKIEDAWGRAAPESAANGVFYMKIYNPGSQDDKLISASSPGCGVIEIHEVKMEGDMMSMHPVAGGQLDIPAGETVELKTGGLHLMCIDKKESFTTGAKIPVTMQFDKAGEVNLEIEIRNP